MRSARIVAFAFALSCSSAGAALAGDAAIGGSIAPTSIVVGASPAWHHYHYHQQWNIPRPHIVPPMNLRRPLYIWNGVWAPPKSQPYPYPPYGTPRAGLPYYAYGIPYSGHPGFYQFFYPHVMVYTTPTGAGPVVYSGYGYYGTPNAIVPPTAAPAATTTEVKTEVEEVKPAEPADVPPLDDVEPAPVPSQPVPGEANRGAARVARQ